MVVLPAPLGPSSAKMRALRRRRGRCRRARRLSPYDLRRPVAAIADDAGWSCAARPDLDASPSRCGRASRRVSLDASGRSAASSALCTRPTRSRSRRATPPCPPGCRPRLADAGLEHDRAARDLAEADVAVGGLGDDAGVGAIDGDVAVGRLDPQLAGDLADPVSPLEFLITAGPSSSRRGRRPEPAVMSASPAAWSTSMSPAPLLSVAPSPPARGWMSPDAEP